MSHSKEKFKSSTSVLEITGKELTTIKENLNPKTLSFSSEIEKKISQLNTERVEAEKAFVLVTGNSPTDYLVNIKTADKKQARTGEIILLSLYGSFIGVRIFMHHLIRY